MIKDINRCWKCNGTGIIHNTCGIKECCICEGDGLIKNETKQITIDKFDK